MIPFLEGGPGSQETLKELRRLRYPIALVQGTDDEPGSILRALANILDVGSSSGLSRLSRDLTGRSLGEVLDAASPGNLLRERLARPERERERPVAG